MNSKKNTEFIASVKKMGVYRSTSLSMGITQAKGSFQIILEYFNSKQWPQGH